MFQERLTRTAALGLAAAAFAAPVAVAQPADPPHPRSLDHLGQLGEDMRNPDNRDTAAGGQAGQDLRSPDARDAAGPAPAPDRPGRAQQERLAAGVPQDLRSPDARDAADGRGTSSAPEVMVVKLPQPAPDAPPVSTGIDWGDASLGAGGLLGLTLLAAGGSFVLVRRRQATPTA